MYTLLYVYMVYNMLAVYMHMAGIDVFVFYNIHMHIHYMPFTIYIYFRDLLYYVHAVRL